MRFQISVTIEYPNVMEEKKFIVTGRRSIRKVYKQILIYWKMYWCSGRVAKA